MGAPRLDGHSRAGAIMVTSGRDDDVPRPGEFGFSDVSGDPRVDAGGTGASSGAHSSRR